MHIQQAVAAAVGTKDGTNIVALFPDEVEIEQADNALGDQYTGQGGFDAHVGEHTQLDGAVIASDATADKNRLDTGTLGWTDIENKAKSGGSQFAVSVSGGVGQNEDGSLKLIANGLPTASLASVSDMDDEKAKIRAEMETKGELKGLSNAQINAKLEQSDQYKKVDEQYGVGSEFWRNGTAITGLLAGVLGGNVTGGMAAGAAPYVAGLIKDVADGHPAARVALHTLASAVLMKAQGGNAAAGAAGGFIAASSSQALSQAFYGKDPEGLSPEEKTVISNLVTALGAAGGSVAGGGSQGIGSGANAARVEVENNSMHGCSPVTCKQDLDIIGGGGSSLGGGMIGGGAGIGLATIISEMFGDDSDDAESKPNAGKDLTDAEKAGISGSGPGTPNGWEPQDEDNKNKDKPKNNYGNQAKKMNDRQISELTGNFKWHQSNLKSKIIRAYSKELKGSKDFDFYRDPESENVFIKSNKSVDIIKINIEGLL